MDISLSHPPFTARRSCFAKRFSKTVLASPANPRHQHSRCWSCHNHCRANRTFKFIQKTIFRLIIEILQYSISFLAPSSSISPTPHQPTPTGPTYLIFLTPPGPPPVPRPPPLSRFLPPRYLRPPHPLPHWRRLPRARRRRSQARSGAAVLLDFAPTPLPRAPASAAPTFRSAPSISLRGGDYGGGGFPGSVTPQVFN
jgi:hypothetical protein